jgi:hypothetical protein
MSILRILIRFNEKNLTEDWDWSFLQNEYPKLKRFKI